MYVALLLSGELKSYFKKKKMVWSDRLTIQPRLSRLSKLHGDIKLKLYIKIPAVIHWFYVPQVIITNCALKSLKLTSS